MCKTLVGSACASDPVLDPNLDLHQNDADPQPVFWMWILIKCTYSVPSINIKQKK
jgi:hypothetical protein